MNQMEQMLQQQISIERQNRAPKENKRIKVQKQIKKPANRKPPYQLMMIAGWKKKLAADLMISGQGADGIIVRAKIGDRLTPYQDQSFIVKAITEKNVKLASGKKSFILQMALDEYKPRRFEKKIAPQIKSKPAKKKQAAKPKRVISGHIVAPASAKR